MGQYSLQETEASSLQKGHAKDVSSLGREAFLTGARRLFRLAMASLSPPQTLSLPPPPPLAQEPIRFAGWTTWPLL